MSAEISGGVWAAVGRFCIDRGFSRELLRRTNQPDGDRPSVRDSEPLAIRLNDEEGFAISQENVIVLHNVIWKIKRDLPNTIEKLQDRFEVLRGGGGGQRSSEFFAVVGLACIDGTYRQELIDVVADQVEFDAVLASTPSFFPAGIANQELPLLRNLLGDDQFVEGLRTTHDRGWRDPTVRNWPSRCQQRLRYADDYPYLDGPVVVNMIQSLFLSLRTSDAPAAREDAARKHEELRQTLRQGEIVDRPEDQIRILARAVGLDVDRI